MVYHIIINEQSYHAVSFHQTSSSSIILPQYSSNDDFYFYYYFRKEIQKETFNFQYLMCASSYVNKCRWVETWFFLLLSNSSSHLHRAFINYNRKAWNWNADLKTRISFFNSMTWHHERRQRSHINNSLY